MKTVCRLVALPLLGLCLVGAAAADAADLNRRSRLDREEQDAPIGPSLKNRQPRSIYAPADNASSLLPPLLDKTSPTPKRTPATTEAPLGSALGGRRKTGP